MLRRVAFAVAVAASSATGLLTFASGALGYGAGDYCVSVLIDSGNTCLAYTPRNIMQTHGGSVTEAGPPGSALACVGGKTYNSAAAPWLPGYVCATSGGQWVNGYYAAGGFGCCTYPAIHNHSTFISRFRGSVEWAN
jgi:hypothetical protein